MKKSTLLMAFFKKEVEEIISDTARKTHKKTLQEIVEYMENNGLRGFSMMCKEEDALMRYKKWLTENFKRMKENAE